jgi:hypothetical protein
MCRPPETSTPYTKALLRNVILKLLAFTFAMIVIPIGSYYATVNTIFRGMSVSLFPSPVTFRSPPLSLYACIGNFKNQWS